MINTIVTKLNSQLPDATLQDIVYYRAGAILEKLLARL
jgi:hypothetical protein